MMTATQRKQYGNWKQRALEAEERSQHLKTNLRDAYADWNYQFRLRVKAEKQLQDFQDGLEKSISKLIGLRKQ
jgi:hypothetical protein